MAKKRKKITILSTMERTLSDDIITSSANSGTIRQRCISFVRTIHVANLFLEILSFYKIWTTTELGLCEKSSIFSVTFFFDSGKMFKTCNHVFSLFKHIVWKFPIFSIVIFIKVTAQQQYWFCEKYIHTNTSVVVYSGTV